MLELGVHIHLSRVPTLVILAHFFDLAEVGRAHELLSRIGHERVDAVFVCEHVVDAVVELDKLPARPAEAEYELRIKPTY